jgi:hypothetical protein
MNRKALNNFFRPITIVFILINAVCIIFGEKLDAKGINHIVLIYANLILFAITLITSFIHIKSSLNTNPYAFVRSVTLSSFIKLIVIGVSVVIYLLAAGPNRSIYAIIAAMACYIVYTILEVNGAMKLNKQLNAKD